MPGDVGRFDDTGGTLERGETDAHMIDRLGESGGAIGGASNVALDSCKDPLNSVEPGTQLLPGLVIVIKHEGAAPRLIGPSAPAQQPALIGGELADHHATSAT